MVPDMWLISRKMETTEISRNILTQEKLLVEFIGTRNSNQEHINKKSLVNLRLLVISIVKNLFLGNKAKEQISKRVFQENKARQIFRETNISYTLISTVWVSGCKKCSFFGKFDVLCFLETPILRFALFTYYRRNKVSTHTFPRGLRRFI